MVPRGIAPEGQQFDTEMDQQRCREEPSFLHEASLVNEALPTIQKRVDVQKMVLPRSQMTLAASSLRERPVYQRGIWCLENEQWMEGESIP